MTPSIVLLGNLLVDDVLADGTTRMGQAGGALVYDAFSVGFVLAHLEGLSVDACLHHAVVTASLAIEGWGPDALLAATGVDANARLRRWARVSMPGASNDEYVALADASICLVY